MHAADPIGPAHRDALRVAAERLIDEYGSQIAAERVLLAVGRSKLEIERGHAITGASSDPEHYSRQIEGLAREELAMHLARGRQRTGSLDHVAAAIDFDEDLEDA